MKHFLPIILGLMLILSANAQNIKKKGVPNLPEFDEKPLHFGFLLGLNVMDFALHNSGAITSENGNVPLYGDLINYQPGINIGIVSNLRLNKWFDLRFLPGISFGQRNIVFINENGVAEENPLEIKSTFIEFPLLIKYSSARAHNFKPYLVGGVNGRLDLAKSRKDRLVLRSLDAALEAGVGIDMYLNYFRFSTEIKASYGLFNVLNPNGTGEVEDVKYTQALDKLTSNIFHLTFYFE